MINLLEKFLSDKNSLTKEELTNLRLFFSSEAGREAVEQWLHEHWQQPVSNYLSVNFHTLYKELERKMERKPAVRVRVMKVLARYAAVLFIPLLLGFTILLFRQKATVILSDQLPVSVQEYSCPPGTRSKILLPDSTQVWLNADSKLILKEDFGYGTRSVSLSGEAYFEVSRKEGLPFIVNTRDMDIRVLGTSFNVLAYPDDKTIEAVLVTGKIEVINKKAYKKTDEKFGMQPAQRLILNGNRRIELKSNVNTEIYTAWIDNKLVFEDTPMEEVMTKLERWYNVHIELKGEVLKKYTFTGAFDNRTLHQILSYIAQSSPITYKMNEDNIIIDMK